MIRQSFNRPSIIVWGLWSELHIVTDKRSAYGKELNDLAHKEDLTRLTQASVANENPVVDNKTDYIAYKKYYGWKHSKPENLANYLDNCLKSTGLPWCITEYGAGSSIYKQQEVLQQTVHLSYWHPENRATHVHEVAW